MIRIQFQIKRPSGAEWVFVGNPHYFLTVEQAREFLNHKDHGFLRNANARIVDEVITVIE